MPRLDTFEKTNDVNRGLLYENKVKSVVRKVAKDYEAVSLLAPRKSGSFNADASDLFLSIKKHKVSVEIKASKWAQMGGASYIGFNYNLNKFYARKDEQPMIDDFTMSIMQDGLKAKAPQVKKFVSFVKKSPPAVYHKDADGLPMRMTLDVWNTARDHGLLRDLNTTVKYTTKWITDHYAMKDTYYIQIGGCGLFYLKDNPLNLPIPQLQGEIDIEMRLGHHGSKMNKSIGEEMVTGDIRSQARLKTQNRSPYSLDREEDVHYLFRSMLAGTTKE